MGIDTILSAKKIVLMANANKKDILEELHATKKAVDTIPASYLADHADFHIVSEILPRT